MNRPLYIIGPQTMIIAPFEQDGQLFSAVIEEKASLLIPVKPINLIKQACLAYGSTYEGRRDAAKVALGTTKKLPIIIDAVDGIYLFPTMSHIQDGCIWVVLSHIEKSSFMDSKRTAVHFRNGQTIYLPLSESSFKKQHSKAALLKMKIAERIIIKPVNKSLVFYSSLAEYKANSGLSSTTLISRPKSKQQPIV